MPLLPCASGRATEQWTRDAATGALRSIGSPWACLDLGCGGGGAVCGPQVGVYTCDGLFSKPNFMKLY